MSTPEQMYTSRRSDDEDHVEDERYSASDEFTNRLQLAKRHEATERERRRMKLLNEAFQLLQAILPSYSRPTRMPKYDCLRLAIRYIKDLREVLREAERDEMSGLRGCAHAYPPSAHTHAGYYGGYTNMFPSAFQPTSSGLPPITSVFFRGTSTDSLPVRVSNTDEKPADVENLQSTLLDSPSVSEIVWHDVISTLSPGDSCSTKNSAMNTAFTHAWQPHRVSGDEVETSRGYGHSGWHFPMMCLPFVRH